MKKCLVLLLVANGLHAMDNKKPLTLYELQQRKLWMEFQVTMGPTIEKLKSQQTKILFKLLTDDPKEQTAALFAVFKKNKREERNKMWRPPIRKKKRKKATPSARSSLQK